jgi:hypothetical protein
MATSPYRSPSRYSSLSGEGSDDLRTIALTRMSAAATEEEAAAVVAALTVFFHEEPTHVEHLRNPWAGAGRLEAQGTPVDRHSLSGGWRR